VITVVSGLPRSGTSLMMQMLAAGGMEIVSDGERKADIDNPRGYCEWEKIKLLPQQPALIAEAEGKAVKAISQLLFALPPKHQYQIIFMERPLAEVLASQAEMIKRRGSAAPALNTAALTAAMEAHLKQVRNWLKDKTSLSVLPLAYHQLVREPRAAAEAIQKFLAIPLDVESMARQVDPSLYRQKIASTQE
jgi:hypothetical protein